MKRYLLPKLLLLTVSLACNSKSTEDSGADGDFSDDQNTEDTDEDPPESLPEIAGADTDPGGCEEVSGSALPGAASMFWGEYHEESEGEWTGEERWLLFANEAWRDIGGEDCVVVWAAAAVESTTLSCTSCDLGLSTSLSLDNSATTCEADIVNGLGTSEIYGIERKNSGDAIWYFANSGERMGDGYHVTGAMNFLTDPSCRWW